MVADNNDRFYRADRKSDLSFASSSHYLSRMNSLLPDTASAPSDTDGRSAVWRQEW